MTLSELNREQMQELKIDYLDRHLWETEGRCISYGEMLEAGEIVPDWIIYDNYSAFDFTDDDFYCTAGKVVA